MPGSGKSTWGKKLAKAMQYTFVDLDKLIEEFEKLSIEEVFNIKGEEYFRELEHVFLQKKHVLQNKTVQTKAQTTFEWFSFSGLSCHFLFSYYDNKKSY